MVPFHLVLMFYLISDFDERCTLAAVSKKWAEEEEKQMEWKTQGEGYGRIFLVGLHKTVPKWHGSVETYHEVCFFSTVWQGLSVSVIYFDKPVSVFFFRFLLLFVMSVGVDFDHRSCVSLEPVGQSYSRTYYLISQCSVPTKCTWFCQVGTGILYQMYISGYRNARGTESTEKYGSTH